MAVLTFSVFFFCIVKDLPLPMMLLGNVIILGFPTGDFMANLKGCFSHNSDHWATPSELYDYFINGLLCFDPCPLHADFDGLSLDWGEHRRIFVNPPYSNILPFVDKSIEAVNKHDCVVWLLLPVRTDTLWFNHLVWRVACDIVFIRGRLHFNCSKDGAPFPSMIVKCRRGLVPSFVSLTLEDYISA